MLGITLRRRYKIINKLGQGGFGETYLAEDMDLPRNPHCVVKRFKPQLTDPLALQEAMRLFDTEADVLYRLGNHEQIPRLLAHFEENQEFYLVQELIDGKDLGKELILGTKWSEKQIIVFLQDLLSTLEFVHQQNVIHRDIKPANLIQRASDGKIVLIDFGAVKEISTLTMITQGKTVAVGTPGYMPSEQSNGQPQLCSDIFAVGIIAIQALTGIHPLQLPKDPKTLKVIWQNQAQISPKLADILERMVEYNFNQRSQSASEVLRSLTSLTKKHRQWSLPKIFLALVVAASILLFALLASSKLQYIFGFSSHNSPPMVTNFLIYENHIYGIRIKYPQTWKIQEIGQNNTNTIDVVKFLPPPKKVPSPSATEITVEVENLKQPISLGEYTNSKVNEITQFLTNAKIDESHPTQLANQPAHQIVYSGKGDKTDKYTIKRKAIWTLKNNNKAYLITYTAEAGEYDDFLKMAEEIMYSLELY
jgi:eukaryotic-like serine/threonine-protein kinase